MYLRSTQGYCDFGHMDHTLSHQVTDLPYQIMRQEVLFSSATPFPTTQAFGRPAPSAGSTKEMGFVSLMWIRLSEFGEREKGRGGKNGGGEGEREGGQWQWWQQWGVLKALGQYK